MLPGSRCSDSVCALCCQVPGVVTVCVDVADIEATKEAVQRVSPVHLLVNNAGVTTLQPFLEVTPDAYHK